MSGRATVGITVSLGTVTAGAWTEPSAYSPLSYVRAVQRTGARPVLLVPDAADAEEPEALLGTLDAVVVTGGAGDVNPEHYGQDLHPATNVDDPVRDAYELALTRAAIDAGTPLLGICRGMQVINVACGGELEQHLPDAVGHDGHRRLPAGYAEHAVRLAAGSLAARAAGRDREAVLSHHHQGVRTVAPALHATGWSELDDTVEAVEADGHPFLLGVLWHPEEDEKSAIIGALVRATARGG
jgi:putative glutamine amidotransferase